jgi:integrase/recombinase XerD
LFPGTENGWRADKPIPTKVVWEACQQAAQRAGITKRVNPHLLRHSFESTWLSSTIRTATQSSASAISRT